MKNLSKKKILYVHGSSDTIGGIETYIESCIFNHKIFEPYVVFINDGILPKRIKTNGFKNIMILNGGRLRHLHKTLISIMRIVRIIKKEKIDVVMGHGFHGWIYAGLVAKFTGIKSVCYIHGILSPDDLKFKDKIGWVASRIKPDLYFVNSQAALKSAKNFYGERIKAVVIYPAINLPTQDLEDTFQALRKELQLPAESKVVSLVGRIQEWKGQEYFVKAIPKILDKVPDAYFLAVGDCTFEQDYPYYDRLLKLADELCLQSRIRFTGFREDIPKIMRLSDVIVHASIRPEPFGLVIIEGMASGKSVIATDMGGPKEIITDGVDGLLIPPKDENAISDAVIRILQDKSLGMRLAENAKTTVKEKFSIERCILKMEKHLESLFLK